MNENEEEEFEFRARREREMASKARKVNQPIEMPSIGKAFAAGLKESIPFERHAERRLKEAGIDIGYKPQTMGERTAKRFGRNLPWALPMAAFTPGGSALSLLASTTAGQTAEELGGTPIEQAGAEIAGSLGVGALSKIAGKTVGLETEELARLSKQAGKKYSLGPGAKTVQGMKYGTGETLEDAVRNLEKFTNEATTRAGNASKVVNEHWLFQTQAKLGDKANKFFDGKIFQTDNKFNQAVDAISKDADIAFGQQGNIVKTIVDKNIRGMRPGGELILRPGITQAPTKFQAMGLKDAITEVNFAIGHSTNPVQIRLLNNLKNELEGLAEHNIPNNLIGDYRKWKEEYHAFATIRDTFARTGKEGVLPMGFLNPQGLAETITTRSSGARASQNPLFNELGEYGGSIFRIPKLTKDEGLIKSAMSVITESPVTKALSYPLVQKMLPEKSKWAVRAQRYGGPATGLSQTVGESQDDQ